MAKRKRRLRVAPSFALDTERISPSLQGRVGEQITEQLYLYNTGTERDMGIVVTALGSAVEDRIIQFTRARLHIPEQEHPLDVSVTEKVRDGLRVAEASFYVEPADCRKPPPFIIPGGLDVPPPFLCRGDERVEVEKAWRGLELVMTLDCLPLRVGQGELELRISPMINPVVGDATMTWEVVVG